MQEFLQGRNLDNLSFAASFSPSSFIANEASLMLTSIKSIMFRGLALLPRNCCCLKSLSSFPPPLIFPPAEAKSIHEREMPPKSLPQAITRAAMAMPSPFAMAKQQRLSNCVPACGEMMAAFRCLMAAARYHLYPPVVVLVSAGPVSILEVCCIVRGGGGAVGGWDWGETVGETRCFRHDSPVARHCCTENVCHSDTIHSLMAKQVVGLCTAVFVSYLLPLWTLNSSGAWLELTLPAIDLYHIFTQSSCD